MEGHWVTIAIFNTVFGESFPDSPFKGRVRFIEGSLDNLSIEINDLRMSDEGMYMCEYPTYPTGSIQAIVNLLVLSEYGVLVILISIVGMVKRFGPDRRTVGEKIYTV